MTDLVPVILAGGSGTRLWPLSREALPKQLLRLTGEDLTLLQGTARRLLALAPASRIVTVGAAAQDRLVRRQLWEVDPDLAGHRLLEPVGRNTAAAVALAALYAIARIARDAVLFVCPSDHVVGQPAVLADAVRRALPAVESGELVTFGIQPTRPETGYGYIQAGAPRSAGEGVLQVIRFVEKPTRPVAEAMLTEGGHFWNAGIFLFRANRILEELAIHEPRVQDAVRRAFEALQPTRPDGFVVPESLYQEVPSVPIDKAVMERTRRIAVVPCEPDWSDLGAWQALWERLPRDRHGNATSGDAILERTSGCLVHAESRLVACAGVQDLAVIETDDAILVARRTDSDVVRAVVGTLKSAGRIEATKAAEVAEPWGTSRCLLGRPEGEVLAITVDPGATRETTSGEPHPRHWIVQTGRAMVTSGRACREVETGGSFAVPAGETARITNPGEAPLRLIEVRIGPAPS